MRVILYDKKTVKVNTICTILGIICIIGMKYTSYPIWFAWIAITTCIIDSIIHIMISRNQVDK